MKQLFPLRRCWTSAHLTGRSVVEKVNLTMQMKPDDFCLLWQKRQKRSWVSPAAVMNNPSWNHTGDQEQREWLRWDDFLLDSACGKQGGGESSMCAFCSTGTSNVLATTRVLRSSPSRWLLLPSHHPSLLPSWLHRQTLAALPVAC